MSIKHVIQKTVGTTPVKLLDNNPARIGASVRVWSETPAYLGIDDTVTVKTGFPMSRADGIQSSGNRITTATDEMWAVAGGTSVEDEADVRVFEEIGDGTPATVLSKYTVSGPAFDDTRPDPTANAGLLILITNTDPPEIQFSDGTAWQTFAASTENTTFPSVTTTGGLNVGADLMAEDDLFVAAHLSRVGNSSVTAVAGADAGDTPPDPVIAARSTDVAGVVTFGTGTGPAAGAQLDASFGVAFGFAPVVVLVPLNDATAALGLYVAATSVDGFRVASHGAPAASQANTVYSFAYVVVG